MGLGRMRPALVLLLLGLLIHTANAGPRKKNFQVLPAIPTQIEEPPVEESEAAVEDDDDDDDDDDDSKDGWDVDYKVNRPNPTDSGEEASDEKEKECVRNYEEEGDKECVVKGPNLTPYSKYKSYKNWKPRPLVVIIIGGLRWDYLISPDGASRLDNPKLKAFNWISEHGTTMSQVVPVFPPYDLPTWTSMATGLYPQKTGVIGDYMFNLESKQMFNRDDKNSSLEGWWTGGEPIWTTAANAGKNVSVLNWHDCSLPGRDMKNSKGEDCQRFDSTKERPKSKTALIRLFNKAVTKIHKHNYHLSIVYTDSLKTTAKKYGPNSDEVRAELQEIDEVLQGRLSDIKNKKERADLKLNVLLLSDYGLNGVNKTTKVVLDDYLNFDHVQYIIQRGGSAVIVPYALKSGDIMEGVGLKPGVGAMLGVDAYVRDVNLEVPPLDRPTIPKELNYGGYTWTQDILLVAKPGFEIEIKNGGDKILPPLKDTVMGTSGYNPDPPPPHIVPGRDKHKSKALRAREKVEGELYNK